MGGAAVEIFVTVEGVLTVTVDTDKRFGMPQAQETVAHIALANDTGSGHPPPRVPLMGIVATGTGDSADTGLPP